MDNPWISRRTKKKRNKRKKLKEYFYINIIKKTRTHTRKNNL